LSNCSRESVINSLKYKFELQIQVANCQVINNNTDFTEVIMQESPTSPK
jgi:hypothetical protein